MNRSMSRLTVLERTAVTTDRRGGAAAGKLVVIATAGTPQTATPPRQWAWTHDCLKRRWCSGIRCRAMSLPGGPGNEFNSPSRGPRQELLACVNLF